MTACLSTFSNDNAPPPLPPHKASASSSGQDNGNEDYKPPVPPHRHTGALARLPDTPKRRHHHQRANSSGEHVPNSRRQQQRESSPGKQHHHHRPGKSRSGSKNSSNHGSSVDANKESNSNADVAFVEVRITIVCFFF